MITSQSIYGRTFDQNCAPWGDDRLTNLCYLKNVETYYNNVLKARGYVLLNEVYDTLGFPRTKAGLVVGWFYDENNVFVDNCIDFNLPDADESEDVDIPIDFNVDGDISKHFN